MLGIFHFQHTFQQTLGCSVHPEASTKIRGRTTSPPPPHCNVLRSVPFWTTFPTCFISEFYTDLGMWTVCHLFPLNTTTTSTTNMALVCVAFHREQNIGQICNAFVCTEKTLQNMTQYTKNDTGSFNQSPGSAVSGWTNESIHANGQPQGGDRQLKRQLELSLNLVLIVVGDWGTLL